MPGLFRFIAIALFIGLLTWSARHFLVDDGYIYARYIWNALHGFGLVFNRGEQVNALTSPFYCYLILGLSRLLGGNVILAEFSLFVLSFLLACILAEDLVPFAGVLMAASQYFYTVIGMETPVFLCMLALTAVLFHRERWNWLPLAYLLLSLTRFEGALLALIFFTAQFVHRKFPRWYAWSPPVFLAIGYLLLNLHYYGQALPTSVGAKFGQGMSGYWGRWPTAFIRIEALVTHYAASGPTIALVPVLLVAAYFGWRAFCKEPPRWFLPMSVFMGTLLVFCVLANLPNYHWYYAPFIFFVILMAARALPDSARARWVALACACCLCLLNAHALSAFHPNFDYLRADAWLLRNAPPGARIATIETGLIGWQLKDDYIIDIIGITTPQNAQYVARRQPERWLAEDRPDYVFTHIPLTRWEKPVAGSPDYEPIPQVFGSERLYRRRSKK